MNKVSQSKGICAFFDCLYVCQLISAVSHFHFLVYSQFDIPLCRWRFLFADQLGCGHPCIFFFESIDLLSIDISLFRSVYMYIQIDIPKQCVALDQMKKMKEFALGFFPFERAYPTRKLTILDITF